MVCLTICNKTYFRAFYRKKPAAANIVALILECTNFALSVGFVFMRMVKLLVAAALYVGRIDTPFLAPGVGRVGSFEIDTYPAIFLKDILSVSVSFSHTGFFVAVAFNDSHYPCEARSPQTSIY